MALTVECANMSLQEGELVVVLVHLWQDKVTLPTLFGPCCTSLAFFEQERGMFALPAFF